MSSWSFNRVAFGICVAAVVAGCGGSQAPLGASGAIPLGADPDASRRADKEHGYKTIFTFDGADGSAPDGELIAVDGVLYGTTSSGGASNDGTVFKITPSGKENVLYSFKGGTDGASPLAGLTEANGTLYGTTYQGGDLACSSNPSGCGTVFKVTLTGSETVLYRFAGPPYGGGPDGAFPAYGSLIDVNGVLYGTTLFGGGSGHGTIFKVTTSGTETELYSFTAGRHHNHSKDGTYPLAGLTYFRGRLYGTTSVGGGNRYGQGVMRLGTSVRPDGTGCGGEGCGTLFESSTSGKEHLLHRFKDSPHAWDPVAGLLALHGSLYGTTECGGTDDVGTVFEIGPLRGRASIIYSFRGLSKRDGAYPTDQLVAVNGSFYGTTNSGDAGACEQGCGTVFKVSASGSETVLHAFEGGTDGDGPVAGLTNLNGTLYGTASNGGKSSNGTVFRIAP